jgi:hypothetical protein
MAGMAAIPTYKWITAPAANQVTWASMNYTWSTTSATTNFIPTLSTANTSLWQYWNSNIPLQTGPIFTYSGGSTLNNVSWSYMNTRYEETQEEQLAREARQVRERMRWGAIDRRRSRQRSRADKLAEDLLIACLSRQQAMDHLEHGWFDVISSLGRRFRIYTRTSVYGGSQPSQSGNVVLLNDEGKQEARYCVHPPDNLPHADAWLAQKLALEADEDTVMAVANLPWRREGHQDIRPAARERHLQLVRQAA